MAVYFVYRSHYDNPGAFHVKTFAADTVLDWFRSIWKGVPEGAATAHAKKLIGRHVYNFRGLFAKIHENGWPPPKTMKQIFDRLAESLYVSEMKSGANHIQILTDDDELEMAIYVFDDHYAAKHPERCAFLMRDDWVLPDGGAHGAFKPPCRERAQKSRVAGEGRTYFAHFAAEDSGSLSDLDMRGYGQFGVVPNVRVPDFARHLLALNELEPHVYRKEINMAFFELLSGPDPAVKAAKGREPAFLKAVAANPDDLVCWGAYSDWLLENGQPTLLERILKKYGAESGSIQKTRNPKKDRVVVQMHVAQASKHVARWGSEDLYHHFVFFDDLWANAHPHLAASLLRAAGRWDPL
jgi:uncharacterized protein (TIGR02996 family)